MIILMLRIEMLLSPQNWKKSNGVFHKNLGCDGAN
jgi:hypothetical protein